MKKTLLLLIVTLLFCTGIVAFLFYYTTQKSFLNNFVRKLPFHALGPSKLIDLKYNNFYFAGASDTRVFLGNANAPRYVFSTDASLKDTLLIKLSAQSREFFVKSPRIGVNNDRIYLFDGATPSIYQSKAEPGAVLRQTGGNDQIYFTQAIALSESSFAIRTFDGFTRQHVLARKIITDNVPRLEPAQGILQKQVDGIFCTDGMFLYDREMARLIYLYHYRNEFICMDTSMKVLYRAHTIDTTTHARIKVGAIASNNSITMAAPANTVNRLSCVYKKWLFVNSNLTADNENKEASHQSSVVDIYNLEDNGAYLFSIYLFNIAGERMQSFGVAHGKIFAIHSHYLVNYALNPKYFEGEERSMR